MYKNIKIYESFNSLDNKIRTILLLHILGIEIQNVRSLHRIIPLNNGEKEKYSIATTNKFLSEKDFRVK